MIPAPTPHPATSPSRSIIKCRSGDSIINFPTLLEFITLRESTDPGPENIHTVKSQEMPRGVEICASFFTHREQGVLRAHHTDKLWILLTHRIPRDETWTFHEDENDETQ